MRRLSWLLPFLAVLATAAPVAAAGDCTLSLEPTTVHVGESFWLVGEDFGTVGDETAWLTWYGPDQSGNSATHVPFRTTDGIFRWEMTAYPSMVGSGEITVRGGECTATATLTVQALPNTDAAGPAARSTRLTGTPLVATGAVSLGLAAVAAWVSWTAVRRRVGS